jgi:hypothetical protein
MSVVVLCAPHEQVAAIGVIAISTLLDFVALPNLHRKE